MTKSEIFERDIRPAFNEVESKCRENGIGFVVFVQFDRNEDGLSSDCLLGVVPSDDPENDSFAFLNMAYTAAAHRETPQAMNVQELWEKRLAD